ncbi:MAG: cystatin domain-containing protein [Thiolinea sp.]
MNGLKLFAVAGCLLFSLAACTDEVIITDPTPPPTTPSGAPEPPPVTPGKNSLPPPHLSQKPPAPTPGGYRAVDVSDQDVFQINKFLEQELYARDGKEIYTKQILKAEKQVVAGTNYRLTLLMSDGNKYQAVIYQDLKGEVGLTSYRRI